jgi:hypothetical protein
MKLNVLGEALAEGLNAALGPGVVGAAGDFEVLPGHAWQR